jgi:hypothetical protein
MSDIEDDQTPNSRKYATSTPENKVIFHTCRSCLHLKNALTEYIFSQNLQVDVND